MVIHRNTIYKQMITSVICCLRPCTGSPPSSTVWLPLVRAVFRGTHKPSFICSGGSLPLPSHRGKSTTLCIQDVVEELKAKPIFLKWVQLRRLTIIGEPLPKACWITGQGGDPAAPRQPPLLLLQLLITLSM